MKERGDLDRARFWAQQIVRRDVSRLDEEHVVSAAVESLAESLATATHHRYSTTPS